MRTFLRMLRLLIPAGLLAGLLMFPACEEEGGELEAVVTVRYLGDTAAVVPGASVVLEKNAIHVDGVTDANGVFRYVFDLEMILDIYASKDTGDVGNMVTLTGSSVIRLKPGTSVYRTVYLGQ